MLDTDVITEAVYEISRRGFTHEFGKPKIAVNHSAVWQRVHNLGTRLWLDTGDIDEAERLWCQQFEALTTNNTLLNKEVQKGIYDELVKSTISELKKTACGIDQKQLVLEIAFVLNAYHGLRLVELFDAHVSVELHTDFGNNIELSVAYAKRYYQICPERFYIKVPLTPAGFLAARKLSRLGIPVNFTLAFSARQNYAAAVLSKPAYVNVFMGRLNSFIADNNLGDGLNVGEKATLAAQRELLKLRDAKRTKSLLIGASMRDASQVNSLAGLDVYTMPCKVAAEYQDDPAEVISSQLANDPEINLAPGVDFNDFNGSSLWAVPDEFKICVDELLAKDIDGLEPADIQAHFLQMGFGDFLPQWTDEDIQTLTADGKIPVYEKWKDRLVSGEIGLDALMNMSAFYSFATDQEALDGRIESLI